MFPTIPESLAVSAAEATLSEARDRDAECILHVRWPADFDVASAAAILDAAHTGDDALCWVAPHGRDSILAIAPVVRVTAEGAERFRVMARRIADWKPRIMAFADGGAADVPIRFLGGFSFAERASEDPRWRAYGAAELVLHRWTWGVFEGVSWAAAATRVRPDDDVASILARLRERPWERGPLPEPQPVKLKLADDQRGPFVARVQRALSDIESGQLNKVVVARAADFTADRALRPGATVAALVERFPQCFTFWLGTPERGAFFGSTPERLLGVRDRRLRTMALAGSAPVCSSAEETRRRGEELLRSQKDRHEHRVVVDAIVDAVQPHTRWLDIPPEPEILRLSNIQHLHTPVVGEASEEADAWTLLDRLHPTPAVGGRPTHSARALIERLEADTRGWYTGGVGWASTDGDLEFAVALRCGLVKGHDVRLFAGAGIVADSRPDKEWDETRQKLQALEPSLAGAAD